jgi:hypothetical protein
VAAGLDLKWSFILTTPWLGLYLLAYHAVIARTPTKSASTRAGAVADGVGLKDAARTFHGINDDDCMLNGGVRTPASGGGSRSTRPLSEPFCTRFTRCFKSCWWVTLNLCLVYVFEYIISSGTFLVLFDLWSRALQSTPKDALNFGLTARTPPIWFECQQSTR